MQRKVKNRLIWAIIGLAIIASGIYIILYNLRDNLVFFYPPSEIHKIKNSHQKVRVGGLVRKDSIKKMSVDKIQFLIEDAHNNLQVEYSGILPALFREGQGIIAEGRLVNNNYFIANKLLAKHDENYMPPKMSTQKE